MMKRIGLSGAIFAAVLALCGIAVSSASADVFQCYLVSNPSAEKEGQFENANCTKSSEKVLKGKWILALLIRPTVETLWCALINLKVLVNGESGAFKDEKCEHKLSSAELNKGDYTEVILPKEPPEILPVPTFTEPLLLTSTSTSAKNILEAKAVGSKIECEKVVSESNFITSNYGTGVLTFTGCKNASGKCTAPAAETHGTIKLNVIEQLVDILPEIEKVKVLTLGVAIGPSEPPLKITCGTATVEVEGAAIGEITGAKSGTKVKTAGLVFKQSSGIQAYTECDLPLTFCTGKVSLSSKFNTAFEQSGEESEDTVTVKAEGKYKEGAAFDY